MEKRTLNRKHEFITIIGPRDFVRNGMHGKRFEKWKKNNFTI